MPRSALRVCLIVLACLLLVSATGVSSTGGGTAAPEPSGGGVGVEPLPPIEPGAAAQDEEVPELPDEGKGENEGEEDDGEVVIPVPVPEDEDDTTTTPTTTTPESPAPAPAPSGGGFSLASTGLAIAGPMTAALLFILAGVALARRRRA